MNTHQKHAQLIDHVQKLFVWSDREHSTMEYTPGQTVLWCVWVCALLNWLTSFHSSHRQSIKKSKSHQWKAEHWGIFIGVSRLIQSITHPHNFRPSVYSIIKCYLGKGISPSGHLLSELCV